MNGNLREFTLEYHLTAAECNAQREISLPLMVQRLIDIATAHADACNIGYQRLIADGNSWVLSRITLEMKRYPAINENYSLTTWVESINRHFSERNVEIRNGQGEPIGYARLVWMAINIKSRRPADLSPIIPEIEISDRPCPIAKQSRLSLAGIPDITTIYQFKFSDIDFNRHVNSTRYVQFILDRWSVSFFDMRMVSRFEIAYMSEAHYNDVVDVRLKGDESNQDIEIVRDGTVCTRARMHFAPRSAVTP